MNICNSQLGAKILGKNRSGVVLGGCELCVGCLVNVLCVIICLEVWMWECAIIQNVGITNGRHFSDLYYPESFAGVLIV